MGRRDISGSIICKTTFIKKYLQDNQRLLTSQAYAPINGLPQDGGAGQPTGIRLRKAHVGGDFDIHNGPQGGKFDSTAILKSGEDLGMSEWSAILENTQKSFERVSRVQGWLNEI